MLQTWNHVVHVWHIFNPELTEARQAFDEIGRFLALHAPKN
jgi:acetyl esterase/lipase